MTGPENFEPRNIQEQMGEPIAYLDPENPDDREILNSLEKAGQECRDKFPTIESAVDAYRKGWIDYAWLTGGYPEDEVEKLLNSPQ